MRCLRVENNEFSGFFLCGQLYRLTENCSQKISEGVGREINFDGLSNYLYWFRKPPASSFFENNHYCFPDQGNVGHHTKTFTEKTLDLFMKYFLRTISCGFLLSTFYLFRSLQINKQQKPNRLHKSTYKKLLEKN